MTPLAPLPPLAKLSNGTPVVYGALGAIFHLEPLDKDDEARFDEVNDLVWDWYGENLVHATLSCAEAPEPIRRAHLDYIASYGANLDVAGPPGATEEDQQISAHLVQLGRDDYSVVCSGSQDAFEASPYSYRFWVEIGALRRVEDKDHLPAHGVLHLTVPENCPLDEFYGKITAIAAKLRIRWGAAGLTFSACESQNYQRPNEAMFAHARRFSGYDVAEYVRLTEPFYHRLRTVNWLTWLGATMLEDLALAGGLGQSTLSSQLAVGDAVLLQAGPRPEAGDVNRRQLPAAYREVDALVRPMRAAQAKDLPFFAPWEESTVERWLRRFELG